jgi:hypothetical protein
MAGTASPLQSHRKAIFEEMLMPASAKGSTICKPVSSEISARKFVEKRPHDDYLYYTKLPGRMQSYTFPLYLLSVFTMA